MWFEKKPSGSRRINDSAAPMGELRCLRGVLAGEKWRLKEQVTIGRASQNEICVSNTPGVSRTHCRIHREATGWEITDCGSTYGTYLQEPGGQPFHLTPSQGYPLESGMLIFIGGESLCFGVSLFHTTEA